MYSPYNSSNNVNGPNSVIHINTNDHTIFIMSALHKIIIYFITPPLKNKVNTLQRNVFKTIANMWDCISYGRNLGRHM